MSLAPEKTCRLVTLGCKVNQYETQLVRESLEQHGFREAAEDESADLCVLSTHVLLRQRAIRSHGRSSASWLARIRAPRQSSWAAMRLGIPKQLPVCRVSLKLFETNGNCRMFWDGLA